MKNRYLRFFLFLVFFLFSKELLFNNAIAQEIKFNSKEINIDTLNEIIKGSGNAEAIINLSTKIYADEFIYNKKEKKLLVKGNAKILDLTNKIELSSDQIEYFENQKRFIAKKEVKVFDKLNEIKLFSDHLIYNQQKLEIASLGPTHVDIKNKYNLKSTDLYFDQKKQTLYSNKNTSVIDDKKNEILSSSFEYNLNDEIINASNIEINDINENQFLLDKGHIKLNQNSLQGQNIVFNLNKDTFGNKENNPRITGDSVIYGNEKTIINNGTFTTCGGNEDCPVWLLSSKQITHYENKKEIHYKNVWLNFYNRPIFYFPKFFHPDPSIKRKSGFLIPQMSNSNNLGLSTTVPYFHAFSESSDLTFKPRIFSNKNFVFQNELRKETKRSSNILDFSINKDDKKNGTETHFFSNSKIEIDKNNILDEGFINLKLEKVSNDVYIRNYSIESTSPIIKDTDVLESSIEFSGSTNNEIFFDFSIESYETLNKPNNDRYEYVYPNYSISKSILLKDSIFNSLDFSSSGSQKKFATNKYEGVQINDVVLSTNNFISNKGLNFTFKNLFKNINSEGTNSTKYKNDFQSEILSLSAIDFSLPLIKKGDNGSDYLTPKISLRYSPNDTKNIKNEERTLNYENIFSLNRIGFSDNVESGKTATLSLNYNKKDSKNNQIMSTSIATIFREDEDKNLPTSSTLGKKQSDFVGNIDYTPNKSINFDYNYLVDNDLDQINLHNFTNTLKINNFVNEFTFYEENNLVGNKSYYENALSYSFNNKNSFTFKTRENKKDNLTEFYNLIYEYKNDCLTASIKYNKEYYTSNNLKPNEELFFTLTLIPLGSTQTDSIID